MGARFHQGADQFWLSSDLLSLTYDDKVLHGVFSDSPVPSCEGLCLVARQVSNEQTFVHFLGA